MLHDEAAGKDINDMDYLGEEIKLGGKVRHLKYTIPGLKMLAHHFGSVVDGLNAFHDFNPSFDGAALDKLVKLTHAGLVHENSRLMLETVEGMIDIRTFQILPAKLLAAMSGSMPESDGAGDDGNPT